MYGPCNPQYYVNCFRKVEQQVLEKASNCLKYSVVNQKGYASVRYNPNTLTRKPETTRFIPFEEYLRITLKLSNQKEFMYAEILPSDFF